MQLSFYLLAVLTAVTFLLLAIVWMFAPARFLSAWGVDFSASAGLVGRRAAALYAGIAVMFFIARNAEASTPRTALIYGMITACLMLAYLGVYELVTRRATKGILAAVCLEIVLSLLFIYLLIVQSIN